MSLLTYELARPWAVAIREEVLARRMPPWPAVPGYGEFKNHVGLSAQEISIVANWVEGGAPEGEPEFLPAYSLPARPVSKPALGATLLVAAGFKLARPLSINAIQLRTGPADKQIKIRAVLPDGSVQPLAWLLPLAGPERKRQLQYQNPVTLPAGSAIEIEPATGAQFALIVVPSPKR